MFMYYFIHSNILQQKYPLNYTIKASIRANLQVLRDKGIIEYIDKYVLELNNLRSIINSNNDDDLVSYLTKSKPKK